MKISGFCDERDEEDDNGHDNEGDDERRLTKTMMKRKTGDESPKKKTMCTIQDEVWR